MYRVTQNEQKKPGPSIYLKNPSASRRYVYPFVIIGADFASRKYFVKLIFFSIHIVNFVLSCCWIFCLYAKKI
ncbi:unnamed protein product, partial [Larinioides sclopetarius]